MSYTDEDNLLFAIDDDLAHYDGTSSVSGCRGTTDMKHVFLKYPHVKLDGPPEEYAKRYDLYLDELDNRYDIFDKTEDLYLETDFIEDVPRSLLQFKRLKKVQLCGSRFTHVNMTCLPDTVEDVSISGSNLDTFLHIGLEDKVYLHTLNNIDVDDFCVYLFRKQEEAPEIAPLNVFPLPDLPLLQIVTLSVNEWHNVVDVAPDFKERILTHPLFQDLSYRVDQVLIHQSQSGTVSHFEVVLRLP